MHFLATKTFSNTLCFLTLVFWGHRFLAFSDLSHELNSKDLLVGMMSDFWIAYLGASFFALLNLFPKSKLFHEGPLALILVLCSMHLVYVGFFRANFIPEHFAYMFNGTFLMANAASVLHWKPFVLLIFWVFLKVPKLKWNFWITSFIALGIHTAHIRYKVQWFVPEPLKYNFFESFFIKLATSQSVSFSNLEKLRLSQHLGKSADTPLLELLQFNSLHDEDLYEEGPAIKVLWQKRIQNRRKPFLIVVLMESIRAIDCGFLNHHSEDTSLTPYLDKLPKIAFRNAYSSGSVTRGGQEAIWCGYPGSLSTSTMQDNLSPVPYTCLNEHLQGAKSFWIHGGEGRFDGQLEFWKTKGVSFLVSQQDFEKSSVKTSWGISDKELFARTLQELQKPHNKPSIFAMILTVSNHIPWQLPEDASDKIKVSLKASHKAQLTTAYTDEALGEFITALKQQKMWADTLLVLAGDHGTTLEAFYKGTQTSQSDSLSHIPLLLSGGLIEELPSDFLEKQRDEFVGQGDVAPFLAYVLGVETFQSFSEGLFLKHRKRPVMSDLGEVVYFPEANAEIQLSNLLEKETPECDGSLCVGKLAFKAFRYLLKTGSPPPQINPQL